MNADTSEQSTSKSSYSEERTVPKPMPVRGTEDDFTEDERIFAQIFLSFWRIFRQILLNLLYYLLRFWCMQVLTGLHRRWSLVLAPTVRLILPATVHTLFPLTVWSLRMKTNLVVALKVAKQYIVLVNSNINNRAVNVLCLNRNIGNIKTSSLCRYCCNCRRCAGNR